MKVFQKKHTIIFMEILTYHMLNCPKCNGKMREGEMLVQISIPSQGNPFGGSFMPYQQAALSGIETTREGSLLWKESTDEEKGWIIKRKETKTLNIKGARCLVCGYIELYVKE